MRRRWFRGGAMAEFLLSAAAFVLLMVALGLVRVARGPGYADRMMAAQLLGTGGIGALLLVGAAVRRGGGGRRGADAGAAGGLRLDRLRQVHGAQDRPPASGRRRGLMDAAARPVQHRRHRRRRLLLPRRLGRPAALSRCLHAAACADQGRQPGPGAGRDRPAAADGQRARGAEAGAGLAAGAAVRRGGVAADRARRAAPGCSSHDRRHRQPRRRAAAAGAGRVDACWRRRLPGHRRLRRLRPAAVAGVGAAARHRRGADRSGDRRRPDRRAADRRGVAAARHRGRGHGPSAVVPGCMAWRCCWRWRSP